jgi:uncharacterized protein
MKKMNKLVQFFGIIIVLNLGMVGIFHLLGLDYKGTYGVVLATAYMFVPMIAALVVKKAIHKEKIKEDLLLSFKINKWFVAAIVFPPLLAFTAFGISLLFPEVSLSLNMEGMFAHYESQLSPEQMDQMRISMKLMPVHPALMILIQGLIAGITINAVAGFGEELGWRGFLLHELRDMKFAKASLIMGAIWGIWHAPLILMGHNYPEHPQLGLLMMTIWCILLSPIFNYITIKTKSVIAASILHGTLNATGGLSILLIMGGNDLTIGLTGLAGFIALIPFIALIYIYDYKISKEKIMGKTFAQSLSEQ